MAQLTPYIESGALTTGDIDLTAGYVTDSETGKKYLMGVPTDSLTGLEAYGHQPGGLRDGPAGQRRKPGQHPQADAVAD